VNPTPLEQLIQFRLTQARESLDEARVLFKESYWRGAINRAYYAMFYSVLALAVFRQEVTTKHSGVIAFFDREFVKNGIFPKALSKSLHLAFQKRQENDYGEAFNVSEEEAQQCIDDAQSFITAIEGYLRSV
jgi:uncharacterized protein (UPF0332 family)